MYQAISQNTIPDVEANLYALPSNAAMSLTIDVNGTQYTRPFSRDGLAWPWYEYGGGGVEQCSVFDNTDLYADTGDAGSVCWEHDALGAYRVSVSFPAAFTIVQLVAADTDFDYLMNFGAVEFVEDTAPPDTPEADMTTQTQIAPLGHTIIALATPPAVGAETTDWIDHLDFVSSSIEQRPAILVVGFSDIDDAETWADQAAVKTSYRVVVACYHGATGQEAEIAAAVAAALADSADPALPFNGVNLGLTPVEPQYQLTFERVEQALHAGVCMLQTGVDGKPEIVRAVSTYRINPDTGQDDDIVLDINGALTLDYTRKVMRAAAKREPRRKNTPASRRNLQSAFLAEALKLDRAEILKNVEARKKELVVVEDPNDDYRANARIPADWVRGMHVVGVTLDVY